jgi:hypothetical protein
MSGVILIGWFMMSFNVVIYLFIYFFLEYL